MSVCRNCGETLAPGINVCPKCGAVANNDPAASGSGYYYQNSSQGYYQQPYAQPYGQPYSPMGRQTDYVPVTSIGKFIGWFLLTWIPTAGFIIAIVFAVDKTNKERANFFAALLIVRLIAYALVILIYVFIVLVFGVALLDAFEYGNFI